jgi:hypothetical protein
VRPARRRLGVTAIAPVAAIACDRTFTSLAVAVRIGDLVPPSDVPGTPQGADVIRERDARQVLIVPADGPALAGSKTARGSAAIASKGSPVVDVTSLLPLLAGSADRLPRDGVFTQVQSRGIFDWFDLTAIRTRTHACMHDACAGTVDCFDRRVDPWERFAPLAADVATPEVHAARAALERYVAAKPPLVPQWSTEETAPEADAGPTMTPDAEERVRQLRALGCVE